MLHESKAAGSEVRAWSEWGRDALVALVRKHHEGVASPMQRLARRFRRAAAGAETFRGTARWRSQLPVAIAMLLAGCSGNRDVLNPATEEAGHISHLWWVYCTVCVIVFLLVMVFVLGTIARARKRGALEAARQRHEGVGSPTSAAQRDEEVASPGSAIPQVVHSTDPSERGSFRIVAGCTIATAIVLFALLVVDFSTGRAMTSPADPSPLTVKITGHQWWWQIEYDDPTPSNIVKTANELHLPIGRPVQLILQSSDVIHSFWIPNLQGKKDLVPGHPTTLWLKPTRTGRFEGQCAEFCGYQHAHMGLIAVVQTADAFNHWLADQRKPAPEPQTPTQKRGRDVFLTTSCVLCHTIQGTPANSHVGPPLTHLASQEMIGANSFPNRRGYLAGWITDPQAMKPGVRMPQNLLSADDLNALLDYLETLK